MSDEVEVVDDHRKGAQIVGPFSEYRLVVDGWRVPFVDAREVDGGMVDFAIDGRFGFMLPAAVFETVAQMLAQAIAVAVGYPSKPEGDMSAEKRAQWQQHVHPAVRFHRTIGLGALPEHEHEANDDPRSEDA